MPLLKKILSKLNGLHYGQEYLCLADGPMKQPLHLYLVKNGREILEDITQRHLFIGYKPLVFALWDEGEDFLDSDYEIEIVFSPQMLQPGFFVGKKHILATLRLRKIKQFTAGNAALYYYEGVYGRHHFLNPFHIFIFYLYNRVYNKGSGNIFLDGNLYLQVQIAYAVPRKISLITVSSDGLYNVFPTDLHGQVNGYYIISLRTGGKACAQVQGAGKVIISAMNVSSYKKVYALGKNHMRDVQEKAAFEFSAANSATFGMPVPLNVVNYKELELQSLQVYGIHTILLFKIIHSMDVQPGQPVLAHIHNSYATWRYNSKIETEYFLR